MVFETVFGWSRSPKVKARMGHVCVCGLVREGGRRVGTLGTDYAPYMLYENTPIASPTHIDKVSWCTRVYISSR